MRRFRCWLGHSWSFLREIGDWLWIERCTDCGAEREYHPWPWSPEQTHEPVPAAALAREVVALSAAEEYTRSLFP